MSLEYLTFHIIGIKQIERLIVFLVQIEAFLKNHVWLQYK